jgi:hypothetical protein
MAGWTVWQGSATAPTGRPRRECAGDAQTKGIDEDAKGYTGDDRNEGIDAMGIYRMKRDLDVRQSAPVPDRFHRAQHGPAVPKPNRTELCSSPTEVVSSLAQLNKRKMRDRFKVSEYGSKPLVNDQDVRRTRPRLGTMGTIGWPVLVCVALNLPLSTRCLGSQSPFEGRAARACHAVTTYLPCSGPNQARGKFVACMLGCMIPC